MSSLLVKAGRYFNEYLVFADFNIAMCKQLRLLHAMLHSKLRRLAEKAEAMQPPEGSSFL